MAIVKSEFTLALNQVATERGIRPEDVLESIEVAVLAAFKKEHPELYQEEITVVEVSKDNGQAKVIEDGKDITPPGFGRIAAQTARQVIMQKIREVEKKTVITQYKNQIGHLVRGRIIRVDPYNVHVDIGKTEALLPREEQIRNEHYQINSQFVFFLKDIIEDRFGHSRVILSRTDERLLRQLFEREVPEMGSGAVVIQNVVRAPGERAKIAVHSTQGGVDPVGACVGQKGIRVQTVTDELGGQEKIDVIQWNENSSVFLTSALSPAKVEQVEIDEEEEIAKVTVLESQAPLAIGRSGVNVNLASRLTGYEIDIIQVADDGSGPVEQSGSAPSEEPTDDTTSDDTDQS